MQIHDIIGVFNGQPTLRLAARNEEEMWFLVKTVQMAGGMPVVSQIEVSDDFDEFFLELPGKVDEPSLN